MALRNFNNTAPPIELTSGVTASASSLPVSSTAGWPAAPFTLAIDRGGPSEELCLCTAVAPTAFTVNRGYDGTTGKTHNVGAIVEHSIAAIDFREANSHVNDPVQHLTVVTSGARPPTPVVDQTILERDTGRILRWDGDSWEEVSYLGLGGGTLTGPLTLAGSPAADLHAVPREYVVAAIAAATGTAPQPKVLHLGTKNAALPDVGHSQGSWVFLGGSEATYGLVVTKQYPNSKLLVRWSFSGWTNQTEGYFNGGRMQTRINTKAGSTNRQFGAVPFFWNLGGAHMTIAGSGIGTVAEAAGPVTVALQVYAETMPQPLRTDPNDALTFDVWEISP